MNKKGIFFTAMAIVIVTLFVMSYAFFYSIQDRETTEKRVSSMSSFLSSEEEDLSRQLYVFGFRFIFLAEDKIFSTNQPISGLPSLLNESFFNGTFYGVNQEILDGATFSEVVSPTEEKASNLNINLSLSSPEIEMSQADPWNVKFSMKVKLFMVDKSSLAEWNKTEIITAYVPVTFFPDPMYYLNAQEYMQNITKSPYSTLVSGADISNLSSHYANGYYIASTEAPSFLNRLQGISNQSAYGIESFINLQKLSQHGVPVQDKSVVDHVYFSMQNPTACNTKPIGMPPEFKLDSAHLAVYNVSCV